MEGPLGINFAPTSQNQAQNAQNGTNQTPIQDAIRVLNLRIPTFHGAGGIAPGLMGAQGSAGIPGFGNMPGGLEQYLRQLFGQMAPQAGGMMPGGAPSPNVTFPNAPPAPSITFPSPETPRKEVGTMPTPTPSPSIGQAFKPPMQQDYQR